MPDTSMQQYIKDHIENHPNVQALRGGTPGADFAVHNLFNGHNFQNDDNFLANPENKPLSDFLSADIVAQMQAHPYFVAKGDKEFLKYPDENMVLLNEVLMSKDFSGQVRRLTLEHSHMAKYYVDMLLWESELLTYLRREVYTDEFFVELEGVLCKSLSEEERATMINQTLASLMNAQGALVEDINGSLIGRLSFANSHAEEFYVQPKQSSHTSASDALFNQRKEIIIQFNKDVNALLQGENITINLATDADAIRAMSYGAKIISAVSDQDLKERVQIKVDLLVSRLERLDLRHDLYQGASMDQKMRFYAEEAQLSQHALVARPGSEVREIKCKVFYEMIAKVDKKILSYERDLAKLKDADSPKGLRLQDKIMMAEGLRGIIANRVSRYVVDGEQDIGLLKADVRQAVSAYRGEFQFSKGLTSVAKEIDRRLDPSPPKRSSFAFFPSFTAKQSTETAATNTLKRPSLSH